MTAGPGAETPIDPTDAPGRVRIVITRAGRPGSEAVALDDLPAVLADPTAFVWIDLEGPARARVAEVARLVDLHPLVAENVGEHNQRAKVRQVDGSVHVVLFVLR